MLRIAIFQICICFSLGLTAQFDTIGGPYTGMLGMTASEDFIFTATFNDFGVNTIQAYSGDELNGPGIPVFTGINFVNILDLKFHQGDLFVASLKNPAIEGSIIYRVEDPTGGIPSTSVLVDIPWPIGAFALKDSTLFLVRAAFFGGGLFTFDLSDPEAEPVLFIDDDFSDFDQYLIVVEDRLLVTSDGKLQSIDLSTPTPQQTVLIDGLDTPSGLTSDDGLLYVTIGNASSNASSQVNIYTYENNTLGSLVESVAQNTALRLFSVARLNGQTYVLETAVDVTGQGYLLREQGPSSLRSAADISRLSAYPNPATNLVTVLGESVLEARAIDGLGRNISLPAPVNNQVDVSSLPGGLYSLLVKLSNGKFGVFRLNVAGR